MQFLVTVNDDELKATMPDFNMEFPKDAALFIEEMLEGCDLNSADVSEFRINLY
jgi:hypothetical protein